MTVREPPARAEGVATLEGIAVADASVVLLVADADDRLLANDKGLVEVARSHGVECWWDTTLLLNCAKSGMLGAEEATDVLYDLVGAGMNLDPQVYAAVGKRLHEVGE